MEVIRDLIREIVGIIFPGIFFLVLTSWFFIGSFLIFIGMDKMTILGLPVVKTMDSFLGLLIFLVFSFVAGQFFRIKTLEKIDGLATLKEYWKKKKKEKGVFKWIDKNIKQGFFSSIFFQVWFFILNKEKIKKAWKEEYKIEEKQIKKNDIGKPIPKNYLSIGIEGDKQLLLNPNDEYWENASQQELGRFYNQLYIKDTFPYYSSTKVRYKLGHPDQLNKFFDEFEKKNLLRTTTFFNFCKSAIIEFNGGMKEEVLSAEALTRLLAGVFYTLSYGIWINLILIALYLFGHLFSDFFEVSDNVFNFVVFSSFITLILFIYAKGVILDRIRRRRTKELNVVYEGFYLLCLKHRELWHFLPASQRNALKKLMPNPVGIELKQEEH